ncbi:hypothetical protein AB0N64_06025 [Microbacterium sp. NPDC089318]
MGILTPASPLSASAAALPVLVDSFDGARDAAPTYGLNDSLATRQTGTARGTTYTRVHGDWSSPPSSPPSVASQVNHPSFAGKLSFWAENSAVRLDAPILADASGEYAVTATVDPDSQSFGNANDWISLMLSRSSQSTGYVTAGTIDVGLTVGRDGGVMLYQRGLALWSAPLVASRGTSGYVVSLSVAGATSSLPNLVVTVNGSTRTSTLSGALPSPYLYLGAYISNGSVTFPYNEVSTVDQLTVSNVAHFADSFDDAIDADPGYGLNDSLSARQAPQTNVGYTRVAGVPGGTTTPPGYFSQVNNADYPDQLSFWVSTSAVRLNSPIARNAADSYEIRAVVDPDPGQYSDGGDWVSMMLSATPGGSGYVTDASNQFGMTVRRNGLVEFYGGGTTIGAPFTAARGSRGFAVSVEVSAASTSSPDVKVTVNGTSRTFELGASAPNPYLYLGAYISNGSATAPYQEVSTIDDLIISRVDAFPHLRYFGTYGTRNDAGSGNHVPDMAGISNLHWINVSPTTNQSGTIDYNTDVFATCPPNSCIVYVGNEFFAPEGADPQPNLDRWNQFVAMLQPYKDKIRAYYLKDEPYFHGVTYDELNWSAQAVRASIVAGTIPDRPIMLTLTLPDLDRWAPVPPDVDWLGVDDYRMDAAQIERAALRLDEMTLDASDRTYMFPPNVPDDWNGLTTEEQILVKQREYLQVANQHPKMIALLNFGLWVFGDDQEDVPRVFDLQERVGTAIMTKP